ncbi:hypothetical protein [Roseinatronobacter sp.]|uniref:hypothetical protein n=1 Tax=Roseinatronobacter sp. TaxID=1945755 RepID=UPI0025FD1D8D|nr:hypothetical protein [Roseibaca sp.]
MSGASLEQLARLAAVLRDRDLARLGKLTRARQALAQKVARLSTRVEIDADPALNAARLAHARWAEQNRIRLNPILARQTAQVMAQKARCARSLGRAQALEGLRAKPR